MSDLATRASGARLAEYGVLEAPGGRDLQALVSIAALVCDVPNAAINLVTAESQHAVATTGIDRSVCSRDDSMCAVVLDDPQPVVVPDAAQDARFEHNAFVDGRLGAVRFYASVPLVSPDGTSIGRLCVFDSTPRTLSAEQTGALEQLGRQVVDALEMRLRTRQLEESMAELTRTRDDLNRSNELLTLFAEQVTHDLRTPLTAVLANAEMLSYEPVVQARPDVSELVAATMEAGRRMASLIDSILSSSRVGAARQVDAVDLDIVLDDVLADLASVLRERSAEVTRGPLPVVRGDRQQLYSLLLNLITNAVKFTSPAQRPSVEVCAMRDQGTWRVTVADRGRGITQEFRESLFDLYARGARSVQGFGIGLATARRVVEAHGGRIGIDDAPGGGALVWFTLPA